jgi:hypothetical protein
MEENNFRKRQRTFSNETIFELLEISDTEDSTTNDISKNMQNLKIDKRVDPLLEELNIKINNLSITLNLKMDKLSKMMTQLLDEKDYVIEHLKNEIELLKHEMKDTKRNIENNDYFC